MPGARPNRTAPPRTGTGNGTPTSPWNNIAGNFGGVSTVPWGTSTGSGTGSPYSPLGTTPVSTTNSSTPDPGLSQFQQNYDQRLQELRNSQNVSLDQPRLQNNINIANSTVARSAAGQEANNARYAAQLGGKDSLAALNRRTTEQQRSQMGANAQAMTEAEQARLDAVNEARRKELTEYTLGGLAGAQAMAGNSLAQQGLGLQQMLGQQNYGLGAAQLELQRQQQEWARQQALLQMQLQTAGMGGQTYPMGGGGPIPTSGGGGAGKFA